MIERPRSIQSILMVTPLQERGGGMFRVVDYLLKAQAVTGCDCQLEVLDSRGPGGALLSIVYCLLAAFKIVRRYLAGGLLGVHVHMAERLSVILVCRAFGIPVILHLHAAQFEHFFLSLPKPFAWVVCYLFRTSSRVIVLGPKARYFVIEVLGVPSQQVSIVVNGVPRPGSNSVVRQHLFNEMPEDRVVNFLFVGNLSERKGVSDFLHALDWLGRVNAVVNWRVDFYGGGSVEQYRELADSLKLVGNVAFHGWSSTEVVNNAMANADVLVLPSYDEGLPLVILEALSFQVPVITCPVGEIPDFLRSGVEAVFITPGDVLALAAALRGFLLSKELRHRMGLAGLALYDRQFSIEAFFDAVAVIHREVFGVSASIGVDNSGAQLVSSNTSSH